MCPDPSSLAPPLLPGKGMGFRGYVLPGWMWVPDVRVYVKGVVHALADA